MHKVIFDTDIGTDIDDLLALALILASPELELLGVTTAYGDTVLRGKLAYRALSLAGRGDVPVCAGLSDTYRPGRPIFWLGHEGANAQVETLPDDIISSRSAPDFILETVRAHPGEVTLCAVAPPTNLAHALERSPETMRQLRAVYLMGGVFGASDPDLTLPAAEHNIRSDPEAAAVVFGSGVPIKLFPLDVTTRVPLARRELERFAASPDPLSRLLYAELQTWFGHVQRDATHLHDPLAVAGLLEPGIVTRSVRVGVRVECAGELTLGATVPDHEQDHVEVALEVDAPRFGELFRARLFGPV